MFFVTVCSKLTKSCMWILSCNHTHLLEMMCHLYFRRYVNLVLHTYCNWAVDDPIFVLIFWWKKHLFLELIFCNLLYLFCLKLISPSEIIFTDDEHVLLRIFVTNLLVLCFDIYMLYPLFLHSIIKVDSILYQKFALWTNSPFRYGASLLYFSQNNLLRVLTDVCRHCNIKCF